MDLLTLMNSGLSFQESMTMLNEGKRSPVWEEIRKHLINGEETGSFMSQYLRKEQAFYFRCFASFLPFQESLSVTMDIIRMRREARDKLCRGLFYPLTLLAATIAGVFLFDRTILPNMTSLMHTFAMEKGNEMILPKIFEVSSMGLVAAVLAGVIAGMYFLSPQHIADTYRFLAVRMPDSLLVQYASLDFARVFRECTSVKLSTRQSIAVMKQLTDRPLVPFIAGEMEKSFLAGETMKDAVLSPYLEKKLARFIRLAVYAGRTEEMLGAYLAMSEKRTERRVRQLTVWIQLLAYIWIGIMLVLIYEVLMTPLSMLRNIQ
jgi:type II secretory pathway component PulF